MFDWLCYRIYLRIPLRWQFTKPALWILERAGNYAYKGERQ